MISLLLLNIPISAGLKECKPIIVSSSSNHFCAILIFSSVNTGISLFIVKRLENGFFSIHPKTILPTSSEGVTAYSILPSLRVKTLWFSSEPKPEICSISETIPVFIISTEYIYGIPVFVSNSIVSSIGSVPVLSFNAKMYLPKVSLSRKLLFKAIAFKKLIPFNKLDFPAPLAPYIAAIFNTGSFSLSIVIWLDKVVLFILGNISN